MCYLPVPKAARVTRGCFGCNSSSTAGSTWAATETAADLSCKYIIRDIVSDTVD